MRLSCGCLIAADQGSELYVASAAADYETPASANVSTHVHVYEKLAKATHQEESVRDHTCVTIIADSCCRIGVLRLDTRRRRSLAVQERYEYLFTSKYRLRRRIRGSTHPRTIQPVRVYCCVRLTPARCYSVCHRYCLAPTCCG